MNHKCYQLPLDSEGAETVNYFEKPQCKYFTIQYTIYCISYFAVPIGTFGWTHVRTLSEQGDICAIKEKQKTHQKLFSKAKMFSYYS